ncbi:hypothetical protein U1Q18_012389 [Sarracenia purpurea var. burkii]
MAATARALFFSRFADLSLKSFQLTPPPPPPFSHHLLVRPSLPVVATKRRSSSAVVSCLVSGVDGGGVSDDFISTRNSGFDREFSVIANMLKKIEPLDTSVISKGVSDSVKDSMKQTISTMLGLLPSDQFSVTVRVSNRPLYRLLMSSIITGYTLWNAEYRISLMRNFDISTCNRKSSGFPGENEISVVKCEGSEDGAAGEVDADHCVVDLQSINLQSLGDLSPEVLNYINQLESELSTAKKVSFVLLSVPHHIRVLELENIKDGQKLRRRDFWKCSNPTSPVLLEHGIQVFKYHLLSIETEQYKSIIELVSM